YANMGNIIKNDSRSFDLAKQAYAAVGVTPRINPMRGGTDGRHLAFKGIATPNLFKGSENSHGQYAFDTVERIKLASDVILSIIELVQDQPVVYHIKTRKKVEQRALSSLFDLLLWHVIQ